MRRQPDLARSTEHTTIVRGPAVPSAAVLTAAAVGTAAASTAAAGTAASVASVGAMSVTAGAATAVASVEQNCLKELGTLLDLKLKQRMSMLNQLLSQDKDGGAPVELKSLTHFYENCIAGLTQQFQLSPALTQELKARMDRDLNDLSHQGEARIKSLGPVSEDHVISELKQALAQLSASAVTESPTAPAVTPAPAPAEPQEAKPQADSQAEPTADAPAVAEPKAQAHGASMRLLTEDETRDAEYQAHPVHGLNTFMVVDEAMSYEESLDKHQSIDKRVNRGLTKKVNPKKLEALR